MKLKLVHCLLGFIGILISTQQSWAAHPICGTWKMNQPGIGESDVKITESLADDGTFNVQEDGLSNAKGWATFKDRVLTIHWVVGEIRAFSRFEVDREHERGHGKVVFTDYGDDFQNGEERTIDGRKVREIKEVTLRRIGR